MKNCRILSYLIVLCLPMLAVAGEKIKFTHPNFMCGEKMPNLFPYLLLLNESLEFEDSAVENVVKLVKQESNGMCRLITPENNIIGEIISTEKSSFNDVPYNYIRIKLLNINGKDSSSSNIFMWTVSTLNPLLYEKTSYREISSEIKWKVKRKLSLNKPGDTINGISYTIGCNNGKSKIVTYNTDLEPIAYFTESRKTFASLNEAAIFSCRN